jgi:CRISPR-associated protein Cas4
MEQYVQISKINDFIFCPKSVFLHSIYESFDTSTYHDTPQIVGKKNHENIDKGKYSSAKRYLQGTPVYCRKYNVMGNIDVYDQQKKSLIERKTKIKKIYDGYKYQLYAQYFALKEMGYDVEKLFLHSLKDNKRYEIPIPDSLETDKFERTIHWMQKFDILWDEVNVCSEKCDNCIYRPLCH